MAKFQKHFKERKKRKRVESKQEDLGIVNLIVEVRTFVEIVRGTKVRKNYSDCVNDRAFFCDLSFLSSSVGF